MGLTWWPVAAAGLACLAAAVALAVLLPMEQARRQLRRLANTSRLTRLPDYSRLARTRLLSMLVTIALLGLLFVAAVTASARPNGWSWSRDTPDPPEEIMLCVGEPVVDPATGEFLNYFAGQVRTYGTQRIAVTSANRRAIPMTRDYQYVAGKLGDLTQLSEQQADGAADNAASFAPAVSYTDYAPSVEDILALCMTGFPTFQSESPHRRSLIYMGPGTIREPGDDRPSLMTAAQVTGMASEAGVQINALAPSDRSAGVLPTIVESTDGQFFSFDPKQLALTEDLNAIRDRPPPASDKVDAAVVGWLGDSPNIPLIIAVAASTLLCLSLAVLRR